MNDSFIFKESPEKDVKMIEETPQAANRSFDRRVLRTAGSRGRSTKPFDAMKTHAFKDAECQASEFLNLEMLAERDGRITKFQEQFDQLEKSQKSKHGLVNSDQVSKYKFDNQILMKKLSEYKKAEKGAMDIVSDYEQMKLKYFTVLQENEKQKLSMQENIKKNIDLETKARALNDEK